MMFRADALFALAFAAGFALLGRLPSMAATYYVSNAGDDARRGTSPRAAWRTIEKINSSRFRAGDRILFRSGDTFYGSLRFDADDAGTPQKPVTVGSYGRGRAIIRSGEREGILVENAGGFVVRDLIFEGASGTVGAIKKVSGVHCLNTLPGDVKLPYLRVLNVLARGYGNCGILVQGRAADGSRSGFQDVLIADSVAHDNVYYGIHVTGAWRREATAYTHRNVTVRDCVAHNNLGDPDYLDNHSGNGIMLSDVEIGLIERCQAYQNGARCNSPNGPIGIWAHASDRIIIQFCESHHNRAGRAVDGGGFDFDGGVSNSILQYNYSHNNDGAGYLLYVYDGSPFTFRNNIVRFNISENDGRKRGHAGIDVGHHGAAADGTTVNDIFIYHNTVFIGSSPRQDTPRAVRVINTTNVHFWNNVFLAADGVPLIHAEGDFRGLDFRGNAYWSGPDPFLIEWKGKKFSSLEEWRAATGQERHDGKPVGLQADPKLARVGEDITLGNPRRLHTLPAYQLLRDSPLRRAALDLRALFGVDPGPRDFYRRRLSRPPHHIGADAAR